MEVSQGNLLEKFDSVEHVLNEIRIYLSRTEDNEINGESRKQDLGIIVDSLQKENEILKRDVDLLHVTLVDMTASKDYLSEKFKAVEQELEESRTLLSKKDEDIIKVKQDYKITMDSLQTENKALKCEIDKIANKTELAAKKDLITVDSLQRENKALKCEVEEIANKAELAKKGLIKTVESLRKENKALKCEVEGLITTVDSLRKEKKALKCEVEDISKKSELAKKGLIKTVESLRKENKALKSEVDENAKKAELAKKDLIITVDSLQKENKALKCEVEDISKKSELAKKDLMTTVESLRKENKALKCEVDEISKKAELAKKDFTTTVDTLQKENKALKCEIDDISKKAELAKKSLVTTVDSLRKENKALKSEVDEITRKAELAKMDFKTTVDSLQEKNKSLKSEIDINPNKAQVANLKASVDLLKLVNQKLKNEVDQLRTNVDSLKSEMAREMQKRDDLIKKMEHQLDMKKDSYDLKLQSLSLEKVELCKKLEVSKLEVEQIRSKSKAFEQHFSAENVKKLIAQVNVLMDNGHIESAISSLTSYVFNANLINSFNLVHIFNKIYRIKEQLKSFEEQLLHSDSCSLLTLTYNELKNNVDYPNLIVNVEKKFLNFCRDHCFHITAFSLCDTLIKIRKCKDAWVYFEQGELLFRRGNYHGAREAYFYSLKYSKEGDSDLQIRYEQARKALQLQIYTNIWTLFNSYGTPLSNKTLHSKYLELIKYYHPDKQCGFVKQYKDVAEYMSKELTQAYRTLSKQ